LWSMKMKNKNYLKRSSIINWPLFLLIFALGACDLFRFKSEDEDLEDPVVASVADQVLKRSELAFVLADNPDQEDSIRISNQYIQSWIKKQLMIREAGKTMTFDEAELRRKLLDYRYALMLYEFEKAYVEANLNKDLSPAEIEAYYSANKNNFSLKEIIVRINFLKLEKSSAQNRKLERLLSSRTENKRELKSLALNTATNYFIEDSTWVRFEDIILSTPLANHPNKVNLIQNNRVIIVDDEIYRYYFKVLEYRLEDQIPPIEFVREEISKILLNKKRVSLVEELQKEVFAKAQENNEFKIYD
jgi:hypothetical protein